VLRLRRPALGGQPRGGLLSEANPELGRAVALERASSLDRDWITYCAMCRDMFAKSGKRALHLYDLIFPDEDGDDRAARPAPGYSDRRENRARLREWFLDEIWDESPEGEAEPFEEICVSLTLEGERAMEDRRILVSDVQKVLLNAQLTGKHLVREEGGRFVASLRPAEVTYWVEYEPVEDGYLIFNAWSHRMRIKGGQP